MQCVSLIGLLIQMLILCTVFLFTTVVFRSCLGMSCFVRKETNAGSRQLLYKDNTVKVFLTSFNI